MFKQVTEDKANVCYKNWAINLLYLQSYINSEKLVSLQSMCQWNMCQNSQGIR